MWKVGDVECEVVIGSLRYGVMLCFFLMELCQSSRDTSGIVSGYTFSGFNRYWTPVTRFRVYVGWAPVRTRNLEPKTSESHTHPFVHITDVETGVWSGSMPCYLPKQSITNMSQPILLYTTLRWALVTGLRNGSMFLAAVGTSIILEICTGSCADVYSQHQTRMILQVNDSSKFELTWSD